MVKKHGTITLGPALVFLPAVFSVPLFSCLSPMCDARRASRFDVEVWPWRRSCPTERRLGETFFVVQPACIDVSVPLESFGVLWGPLGSFGAPISALGPSKVLRGPFGAL